ncbi:spastin isoform X1 [Hydra vulgaris]|uniref:spastin isoform X1 n=1 Tax=Hydra vulgaris TaxID=6087 RepID=UPI000640E857|nr:spastin isoform X1 [Hydra vulgaris]
MEKESSNIPSSILNVRKHHKQAYTYLSNALQIDEREDNCIKDEEKVLAEYTKGVKELEKGIEICLVGSGQDYDRARKLQDKMSSNIAHAKGRIHALTKSIEEKKSQQTKDNRNSRSNQNGNKATGNKAPPQLKKDVTRSNSFPISHDKSKKDSQYKSNKVSQQMSNKNKDEEMAVNQVNKVSHLKNVDSKHANLILNEIIEKGRGVSFDDIGGMNNAKQILEEIVILPALRPELFTGLRAPARGLLLFGPPGNGKTLLAKAVATQSKATFFNISAATLTSKWVGEGEKMVKAMFATARELQPSIVFIDEVDSLLCERKENENEATRRIKTEFLVGFDGVISDANERILIMGATNRPWELDDAALRRFVKRVQVPLPDVNTRKDILKKLLSKESNCCFTEKDYDELARITENYSGSDIAALARDAALMPVRELKVEQIKTVDPSKVRGLKLNDFISAMKTIRPSMSVESLSKFDEWNSKFGVI